MPSPDPSTENEPSKAPDTRPVLARSTMHSNYGGVFNFIFTRLFGPIHYPDEAMFSVRDLAREGTIVYVTRARSTLRALYFNHTLGRLRLPLPTYVGGLSLLLWQPIHRLVTLWRQRKKIPDGPWRSRFDERDPSRNEALLCDVVHRGECAFLFLPPSRAIEKKKSQTEHDYCRALISAQRSKTDRPIYLIPHVLTDRNLSGGAATITDRVFGSKRNPGGLRLLAMFLSTLRSGQVRVGDAIDLRQYCNEHDDIADALLSRQLRHVLQKEIDEEERVVAGPPLPEPASMRRHVLRDPMVRSAIEECAKSPDQEDNNVTLDALEQRKKKFNKIAQGHIKHIAARYSVNTIRVLSWVLRGIFNRIYDGIVVDEQGLRKVLHAARRGPVVYCPSHRSHVDYLVMSYVLWRAGVVTPHIAAGANLSFFPLGGIFRRAGAFFLRRSFRDDKLYATIFRSYIAELLRSGTSIEFFPEGTRSRSGKLLMPRFGLLHMIVDAWRAGAREDVQFVPVSIDYERIIEGGTYVRELKGAEKPKESLAGVLGTAKILRSRYGRLHLQFGTPVSLKEVSEKAALPADPAQEFDDAWRVETAKLGYRIHYGIASVCSVTPMALAATALLSHRGRALSESRLLRHCLAIADFLAFEGARFSESLSIEGLRSKAIMGAVEGLAADGLIIIEHAGRSDTEPLYLVPEDKRVQLDYYKNGLMNLFAPTAILARSLLRAKKEVQQKPNTGGFSGLRAGGREAIAGDTEDTETCAPIPYDTARKYTRFLSRIFKREFIYRVDAAFASHFDDTLATLAMRGLLDVMPESKIEDGEDCATTGGSHEVIVIRDGETLELLAGLLDEFIEAYWVTAESLAELEQFPLWDKELESRALDRCRRAFLEGEITRPEAANQALIHNAIDLMKTDGIVTSVAEQTNKGRHRHTIKLADAYTEGRLAKFTEAIRAYL